jgi:hypothetical protein
MLTSLWLCLFFGISDCQTAAAQGSVASAQPHLHPLPPRLSMSFNKLTVSLQAVAEHDGTGMFQSEFILGHD